MFFNVFFILISMFLQLWPKIKDSRRLQARSQPSDNGGGSFSLDF